MGKNITQKIIAAHLVSGKMKPGSEIGLRIDQTLTQDATGTMAWLQFGAMGLPRVKTELSVSYVDHNTLQQGFRNPDDHRFLRTMAAKYGAVFSPPGTGICHQLHLENFAKPGKTLIGSDSHTPTAGGVGSLAMGAGGLSVALAMGGEPYFIPMPQVVRVWLEGELTGWAAGKDVILYLLGKLTVKGGVNKVFEYAGPGVANLSVPERATITNMGAELGATASLFPADQVTKKFLTAMGRPEDYTPLKADPSAAYDEEVVINLSELEPMAARPHMPDLAVTIRELDGMKVDQAAIGSCTNSSYADLKTVALMLKDKRTDPSTDTIIAPGSKLVVKMLADEKLLEPLLDSGARLFECACGPCIGIGGSPVSAGVAARTFNRNFEGRSGTQDAQVYLVSPQTAAQAALNGKFTDPATWGEPPAKVQMPRKVPNIRHLFVYPPEDGSDVEILLGPNIAPLSRFAAAPEVIDQKVALKVGDNITTDHILPGGSQVMSLRSNIPAISEHTFINVDKGFVARIRELGGGVIVGGENYGQGSSREHAALAPKHLGVTAVVVKSMARIHRANLVNFGILPLIFEDKADYDKIAEGQSVVIPVSKIKPGKAVDAVVDGATKIRLTNDLTRQELDTILVGGTLNAVGASGN